MPSEHERLEKMKSEASAAKRSRRHFMKQPQGKDEGRARGQLARIRRFDMQYKICCILKKYLEIVLNECQFLLGIPSIEHILRILKKNIKIGTYFLHWILLFN